MQPNRTLINAHAVVFVNHIVAYLQVRKGGNLLPGASAGFCFSVPGTVNVRIGNKHQFGFRPDKAVAKGHG